MTFPAHPFRYVGGVACFDLVNTARWSEEGEPLEEGLADYDRVVEWAEGADLISPGLAGDLREMAADRPRDARTALAAVREARRILRDLFVALAAHEDPEALGPFNALLAEALANLQLASLPPNREGAIGCAWAWRGMRTRLDSVLWPVVWSAARLLASGEATAIRVCGGEDCGWTYVDRSRNGFRRWCEMETCGTREKSRRRKVRSGIRD